MSNARVPQSFSIDKAHQAQVRLSKHLVFQGLDPKRIHLVGGVDVAYANTVSVGAVVTCDFNSMKLEESQTATCPNRFPYVPTLLAFREIPPVVRCIRKLCVQPDVFLVNGHGYAHPYRCGFASYLGLVVGRPTIGVAKNILVGKVLPTEGRGNVAYLGHDDEIIGAEIRLGSEHRPVYVSVGHLTSLDAAIRTVKQCLRGNRLPEPIKLAHEIAEKESGKYQ